jgi:hypothetical protein
MPGKSRGATAPTSPGSPSRPGMTSTRWPPDGRCSSGALGCTAVVVRGLVTPARPVQATWRPTGTVADRKTGLRAWVGSSVASLAYPPQGPRQAQARDCCAAPWPRLRSAGCSSGFAVRRGLLASRAAPIRPSRSTRVQSAPRKVDPCIAASIVQHRWSARWVGRTPTGKVDARSGPPRHQCHSPRRRPLVWRSRRSLRLRLLHAAFADWRSPPAVPRPRLRSVGPARAHRSVVSQRRCRWSCPWDRRVLQDRVLGLQGAA